MICDGCNQERDDSDLVKCMIVDKEFYRYARCCGRPKAGLADVYFDGKPEINLADDPRTGKPRVFSSAREKADYLKANGIMEAGDRHHGAPVSSVDMEKRRTELVKQNNRREIRESLEKVRQMSPDHRHSEYLRVMKENQRYGTRS